MIAKLIALEAFALGASLLIFGIADATPGQADDLRSGFRMEHGKVSGGALRPRLNQGRLAPRLDCPDLAVSEFRVELLSRSGEFQRKARVRFTAVVTNIGTQAFVSGNGQQALYILENPAGGGEQLRVQRSFARLNRGQSVAAIYHRNWHTGMEFAPSFTARISYDPDINADGNDRNDDCRHDNNARSIRDDVVSALLD